MATQNMLTLPTYLAQRVRHTRRQSCPQQLLGYYQLDLAGRAGLNSADLSALEELLPLDYMGSAEYEFGAVPTALIAMAQARDYAVGSIRLQGAAEGRRDTNIPSGEPQEATLWYYAPATLAEEADTALAAIVKGQYNHKENPRLAEGLFGWMEPQCYPGTRKRNNTFLQRSGACSTWLFLGEPAWLASSDYAQFVSILGLLGQAPTV